MKAIVVVAFSVVAFGLLLPAPLRGEETKTAQAALVVGHDSAPDIADPAEKLSAVEVLPEVTPADEPRVRSARETPADRLLRALLLLSSGGRPFPLVPR